MSRIFVLVIPGSICQYLHTNKNILYCLIEYINHPCATSSIIQYIHMIKQGKKSMLQRTAPKTIHLHLLKFALP